MNTPATFEEAAPNLAIGEANGDELSTITSTAAEYLAGKSDTFTDSTTSVVEAFINRHEGVISVMRDVQLASIFDYMPFMNSISALTVSGWNERINLAGRFTGLRVGFEDGRTLDMNYLHDSDPTRAWHTDEYLFFVHRAINARLAENGINGGNVNNYHHFDLSRGREVLEVLSHDTMDALESLNISTGDSHKRLKASAQSAGLVEDSDIFSLGTGLRIDETLDALAVLELKRDIASKIKNIGSLTINAKDNGSSLSVVHADLEEYELSIDGNENYPGLDTSNPQAQLSGIISNHRRGLKEVGDNLRFYMNDVNDCGDVVWDHLVKMDALMTEIATTLSQANSGE